MQQSITTEKIIYDAKKEEALNLEYSLAEYLPGISSIIKTDAVFHKCDFHEENGKAFVDIGAKFNIIYLSDFGGKIKCATFDEDFSVQLKEPFDFDLAYTALPDVYASSLGAKPVSGRKILIKGTLHVNCSIYAKEETHLYSKEDDSDHICTLTKDVTCCEKLYLRSDSMSASAELNLEKDSPAASDVIMSKANIHTLECKCDDGKINIFGKLFLYALYECIQEENSSNDSATYAAVSSETGFEASLEDPRINEHQLCTAYIDINSIECSCSYDSYGESRIITYNIKYTITANLFENKQYSVTEDVFSTKYLCQTDCKKIVCHSLVKPVHCRSAVSESVHGDLAGLNEISGCFLQIRSVSKESTSGKNFALARCLLEILGVNSSGELMSTDLPVTLHIPVDESDCSDESLEFIITVCSCNAAVRDGSIDAEFVFDINGICQKQQSFQAVCSVAENTDEIPVQRNKGEIIVCYPNHDDTLWSLAKRYAVTPESITRTNNLDTDAEALKNIIVIS